MQNYTLMNWLAFTPEEHQILCVVYRIAGPLAALKKLYRLRIGVVNQHNWKLFLASSTNNTAQIWLRSCVPSLQLEREP